MENNIKAIRILRGLSQQQMADALDVKIRTYRSWEHGEVVIGLDKALEVANVLGCKIDDLVTKDFADRFIQP